MINVLILINSFQLGGAEKLSYDLCKEFLKQKQYNVFLCSMGKVESEIEQKITKELQLYGIKCLSLNKQRAKGRVRCIIKLRQIVKTYHIDVIHTNGQSPDFYARLLRVMSKKIRILTTIHNTAGYSRIIEKFLQRYTDMYTAVSKDTYYYAKNKLRINKQIRIIENGIDTDLYSKIKTDNSSFVILTVARIAEQKGYLESVELLAPFINSHPDVIWKIYGDVEGHKDYYTKLIESIKSAGLESKVVFEGVSSDPHEIYSNASCFVLASSYEGFGISFIEAMSVGLPVIAHQVGCLIDIKKSGGWFIDISHDCVFDFLNKLYISKSGFDKNLEDNKIIIEQLYSIQSKAQQYAECYQYLMKGTRK